MTEEWSGEMKKDLLRAIPANRFEARCGAIGRTSSNIWMGPDADYMTGQGGPISTGASLAVDG